VEGEIADQRHQREGEPYSLAGLCGDYLREASVLTLVFGWLEPLLRGAERPNFSQGAWALLVLAISIVLFGLGAFLEWKRKS
jgi:hypothetical protein